MKLNVYTAEFSKVIEHKEGEAPKYKNCGSVEIMTVGDYEGSLAGLAYKRATPEQLDCSKVTIRRKK